MSLAQQDLTPLPTLISSIRAEFEESNRVAGEAIERAVNVGILLQEARAQVRHGAWADWVESNMPFQPRMAQKYIRLAEKSSLLGNANSNSHLTVDGALKLIAAIEAPASDAAPIIDIAPAPPTRETECFKELELLQATGRKFGTIYADPPWAYGNQGTRAATDNHYVTMSVDDICALPVAPLALDKAHLHLWTTNAFLFDARRVMEAWGFEYKSCFVWVKPQIGIGNYWRVSHEFMLLGVRGGLTFLDKGAKSWMMHDRTQHSAKPEPVRQLIERTSPGPYLELFGRRKVEEWTVWGNEIERDLFNPEGD